MFFGGPRFDTGLTAHGVSHYCWTVAVDGAEESRYKWGGLQDSVATKHGQPTATGVGMGERTTYGNGALEREASPEPWILAC